MYFGNDGIMFHNFDIFNPVLDLLAIPLFPVRLIKAVNMESAKQFPTECNCPTLSLSSFQIKKRGGSQEKIKLNCTDIIVV